MRAGRRRFPAAKCRESLPNQSQPCPCEVSYPLLSPDGRAQADRWSCSAHPDEELAEVGGVLLHDRESIRSGSLPGLTGRRRRNHLIWGYNRPAAAEACRTPDASRRRAQAVEVSAGTFSVDNHCLRRQGPSAYLVAQPALSVHHEPLPGRPARLSPAIVEQFAGGRVPSSRRAAFYRPGDPSSALPKEILVKAVVYHGPRNVSVDEVPDAKIEKPTDALVRITATNICGSDLHMYEGRTDSEAGRVFGHENVGGSHRGRRRRGLQDQSLQHDLGSVQRRLRVLPQLRRGADQLLPACQPARHRRRRVRVRRYGPMQGGQADLLRVPWPTSTACGCQRTPARSRTTT